LLACDTEKQNKEKATMKTLGANNYDATAKRLNHVATLSGATMPDGSIHD